jgi:hypothetical protein
LQGNPLGRARSMADLAEVPGVYTARRIASSSPVRDANADADADDSHRTVGGHESEWQPFLEGVCIKVLREQADTLPYLLRLAPGATLPPHRHPQNEECLVFFQHPTFPYFFCTVKKKAPGVATKCLFCLPTVLAEFW